MKLKKKLLRKPSSTSGPFLVSANKCEPAKYYDYSQVIEIPERYSNSITKPKVMGEIILLVLHIFL